MRHLTHRWPGRQRGWLLGVGMLGLCALALWAINLDGGVGARLLLWQRELHRGLTLAITRLSSAPSAATWASLLGASFGYGVFHAAGPGHGKAVLSTYLLSQGGALWRALALSIAASLLQAVVAIALVMVLVHGLGWLTREAMGSVAWVEQASFVLVTLLGLWLCLRALRQLRDVRRAISSPHHAHSACGHEHHVAPERSGNWRTALATVVAIGMRPCSGGVLVLGAASLLGQFWAGLAAVLVMAAGTALAVSALALLSVTARGWAERRLATTRSSGPARRYLPAIAALAGGLVIAMLGLSLSVAGVANDGAPLLSPPANEAPRSPFSR